jgi:hypothetical protein
MVSKGRHPKKAIADALARLDAQQILIEEIHRGHRWGRIVCRGCGQDLAIFSTPQVPETNARPIDRSATQHASHTPHGAK